MPNRETPNPLPDEIRRINFFYVLQRKASAPDRCVYCDALLTPETRSTEHIVPRTRIRHLPPDWRNAFGALNTVPACRSCNNRKGSSSLEDFAAWLRRGAQVKNRILILSHIKHMMQ